MAGKNKIRVEIDGINFSVSGNEDENYIKHIASYVDKAIVENNKKNPHLSKTEGIILLALNLKDELEKQKLKYQEMRESLKDTSEAINVEKIENADEEIKRLKDLLKEKDQLLEKFKIAEEINERKLNAEMLKAKDLQAEINLNKSEKENQNKEVDQLRKQLEIQEKLNFDRNKEIIGLKNSIRALKEEKNKFEK